MARIKNKIKEVLEKLRQLQGSPGYLAKGVALGIFIGFAPVMPLKTVLILAFSFLISSSPIAAILVCTLVCNPVTYIPLYYLAWLVGDALLPGLVSWQVIETTVMQMQQAGLREATAIGASLGLKTLGVMLVGGGLLGIIPALASYPLSYRFFVKMARRRAEKHVLNNS
jgi:uncharacterized protein (DUF2062 family)